MNNARTPPGQHSRMATAPRRLRPRRRRRQVMMAAAAAAASVTAAAPTRRRGRGWRSDMRAWRSSPPSPTSSNAGRAPSPSGSMATPTRARSSARPVDVRWLSSSRTACSTMPPWSRCAHCSTSRCARARAVPPLSVSAASSSTARRESPRCASLCRASRLSPLLEMLPPPFSPRVSTGTGTGPPRLHFYPLRRRTFPAAPQLTRQFFARAARLPQLQ